MDEENKIIDRAKDDEGKISVKRNHGNCSFCDKEQTETIEAYAPEVYEGSACADCILDGKTGRDPMARIMRPMTFVAKAYKGVEPFASTLARADLQREQQASQLASEGNKGNALPKLPRLGNRKTRARARALARKAKSPRKKPKKKKRVRL